MGSEAECPDQAWLRKRSRDIAPPSILYSFMDFVTFVLSLFLPLTFPLPLMPRKLVNWSSVVAGGLITFPGRRTTIKPLKLNAGCLFSSLSRVGV